MNFQESEKLDDISVLLQKGQQVFRIPKNCSRGKAMNTLVNMDLLETSAADHDDYGVKVKSCPASGKNMNTLKKLMEEEEKENKIMKQEERKKRQLKKQQEECERKAKRQKREEEKMKKEEEKRKNQEIRAEKKRLTEQLNALKKKRTYKKKQQASKSPEQPPEPLQPSKEAEEVSMHFLTEFFDLEGIVENFLISIYFTIIFKRFILFYFFQMDMLMVVSQFSNGIRRYRHELQ